MLGIAATVVVLPLMLIIAIAIKLESTGPVLYRQDRIGFLNKVFCIYKFRTMRWEPPAATTVQATRNDPRVTRVGRLLRRTSLDELPNLINVLNGTMSLVGRDRMPWITIKRTRRRSPTTSCAIASNPE